MRSPTRGSNPPRAMRGVGGGELALGDRRIGKSVVVDTPPRAIVGARVAAELVALSDPSSDRVMRRRLVSQAAAASGSKAPRFG